MVLRAPCSILHLPPTNWVATVPPCGKSFCGNFLFAFFRILALFALFSFKFSPRLGIPVHFSSATRCVYVTWRLVTRRIRSFCFVFFLFFTWRGSTTYIYMYVFLVNFKTQAFNDGTPTHTRPSPQHVDIEIVKIISHTPRCTAAEELKLKQKQKHKH